MATRILFCAESTSVRKAIRNALPRERMELVPVSNAELAKYLLDLIHPDLVLAVAEPPGGSVFELDQYIKENQEYRQIPVILVVASAPTFNQIAQAGPLVETIDTLLQGRGENRTVVLSSESLLTPDASSAGDSATSDKTESVQSNASESDAPESTRLQWASQTASKDGLSFKQNEREIDAQGEYAPPRRKDPEAIVLKATDANALALISSDRTLAARSPKRSRPRRVRLVVITMCLLIATGLAAYQATIVKQAPRGEKLTSEESPAGPSIAAQPPPDMENNAEAPAEAGAPDGRLQERAAETSGGVSNRIDASSRPASPVLRTKKPTAATAESRSRVIDEQGAHAKQNAIPQTSNPLSTRDAAAVGEGKGSGQTVTARRGKSSSPGSEMRTAGSELKQAGEHLGSGIKHLGIGAKNAVIWSGKAVGRAFKHLGNGLKKAIRG